MKKLAAFFSLMALLFANDSFANAVATSVTGTVQAQSAAAAPRTVRQGDVVRQGETVTTGAVSSVVLRFDDGQIAALTSNSRLAITTYTFNPQTGGGNVLLNLLNGGMRAISGLIGKTNPQSVSYRAATATIGIRGTDTDVVNTSSGLVVSVHDGSIIFTLDGQAPIVISAGEAIRVGPDGTITRGAIQQIVNVLQQTPGGQAILEILRDLRALTDAINQALVTGGGLGLIIPPGSPGGAGPGGGGTSGR